MSLVGAGLRPAQAGMGIFFNWKEALSHGRVGLRPTPCIE
jgi:hypothetical protein